MQEPESDLGVPFPGRPLPRDRWTRARVSLPPPGKTFDWSATFGREAPRVLDLGCGNGRFLLGSALAHPTRDHLGIDLVPPAIQHAARRASERGLANLKYAWGDALVFFLDRTSDASVDELHVYHPQPYYEVEDRTKRMLTPAFLARAWRVLRPGGTLVLQTDNPYYWRYLSATVPSFFEWRERAEPWPEAPRGRTRREIVARAKGLRIFRAECRRRDALSLEETARLAASLPEPEFDANKPPFRASPGEAQPPRAPSSSRGPGTSRGAPPGGRASSSGPGPRDRRSPGGGGSRGRRRGGPRGRG